MNNRLLILISVCFSVALIVLIWFQVYWISQDFNIREEVFSSKVEEVLNATAARMEKLSPRGDHKKIIKRTQGITFNNPNYSPQGKKNVFFRTTEETSIDSNGHQISRLTSKDMNSDSSLKFSQDAMGFLAQIKAAQSNLQSGTNDLFKKSGLNGYSFFNRVTEEDYYNDYKQKLDTVMLDSLLQSEMEKKQITARYI